MKKFLSVLLAGLMLTAQAGISGLAAENDVVILFTNDTHCEVNADFGFADISALEAIEKSKGNEVIVLDAGDAVQGGAIGSISRGGYIIEIMNEIGYDAAALGNHEFDYGMDRLKEISEMADFPYICANLISLENNKPLFEPYHIIKAGGQDIAFVGITTPHTFTSAAPEYFKNEAGEFIYDFGGNGFYELIQTTVDNAKKDGADAIIAVTHMGVDEADTPYTSKELIANTTGLDAVIDAHSHTVIESESVKNKNGDEVLLASTGSKFENIGAMRISSKEEITTELINKDYKADGMPDDAQAAYDKSSHFIEDIKAGYSAELEKVVAVSECDLTVNDPSKFSEETGAYRVVRRGETNMGDFCADAYRAVLDSDIAVINGGGVRADISKGDVTYGDILNVNPFGNDLCVIEVTGAQILDALEHGVRSYPLEEGAFLQVSGLTYELDPNVSSTVVLDDKGMFTEVSGERRVKNVKVAGKAIDEKATYTLGGNSYILINGGDGFSMFEGARVINDSVCSECDALIQYVSKNLNGTISKEYENPLGSERIKIYAAKPEFTDTENHWAKDIIDKAVDSKLVNGVTETTFEPDSVITRGMIATILYHTRNSSEYVKTFSNIGIFEDVAEDAYYKDAIAWVCIRGIMTGVSDTHFAPDEPITREQLARTIYNYCADNDSEPPIVLDIDPGYTDNSDISAWSRYSVVVAHNYDIMTGDDNNMFRPQASTTRAEATAVIMRALDFLAANQ